MSRPRVSVLLPTHNRADVVGYAIRSALAQTMPDFELLVAGDGCSDGTASEVRSFDDPRIHWFDFPKAPHLGYANRNRALREAQGEYVAYLAHDDLWFEDHLERLITRMDSTGAEIGYTLLLLVAPDGTVTPRVANAHDERFVRLLAESKQGLGITCVAHRRDAFDRHGAWNEDLPRGGDSELWGRIIRGSGGNVVYEPVATALHFVAVWRRQTLRNRLKTHLQDLEGLRPPQLRVAVPDGVSEQRIFWERLSADAGFARELRRGSQLMIDRQALAAYPSVIVDFLNEQWKRLRE